MREISSLVIPQMERKSGSKRKKCFASSTKLNDPCDAGGEAVLKRKKVKKIKIRLADPNIPDSYVCEVFDSSLEPESGDEDVGGHVHPGTRRDSSVSDEIGRGRDKSKPKNYFDLLMSNHQSRRSGVLNTSAQNDELPEERKLLREVECDEERRERKATMARNKGKLMELVNRKRGSNGYQSEDSDDESIFQPQRDLRLYMTATAKEAPPRKPSQRKSKNKENTALDPASNSEELTTSDAKMRNTNLLSYFTKSRKLTEIDMFAAAPDTDAGVNGDALKCETVKLAPLFQKRVKSVIDPNVKKARLDFLQSGLPASMRRACDRQRGDKDDANLPDVTFPIVSHVQQRDDDPAWTPEEVTIPVLRESTETYVIQEMSPFRFSVAQPSAPPDPPTKSTEKNTLRSLKSRYRDVDVDTIYNALKKKKENFLKNMEDIESVRTRNYTAEIVEDDAIDGSNALWTEVYKPESGDIMGNSQAVAKLSAWLTSWKEYNDEVKRLTKLGVKVKKGGDSDGSSHSDDDDDDDDFVSSSGDFGLREPGNICMVHGAISSGKTALVYALAKELGYNVLEVNASSKRSGKKLMLDLQEATKSHQVSSGFTDGRKETKPKIAQRTKPKKRKKTSRPSDGSTVRKKMSLILIEDADVYFDEHDEGFASAIATLVQSSKRPFIFLANDPGHGYLDKLRNQQALVLEMRRPSFSCSCAVLDVIATLEGVTVDRCRLESLIRRNRHDLRTSIHELQFWIQSGRNLALVDVSFELGNLWWGFNRFLYKRDRIHHLKMNYRKRKRWSELCDSSSDDEAEEQTTETLTKKPVKLGNETRCKVDTRSFWTVLDAMTVADVVFRAGCDNGEPTPSEAYIPKDSLSLDENTELAADWSLLDLSRELASDVIELSSKVFARGRQVETGSGPSWKEIRWRTQQDEAKRDLMSVASSQSKRVIHLDYLPAMRNICRTEKSRYLGNTKRKNRFQHYFRSLGLDLRDELLDVSCDVLDGSLS